MEKKQNLIVFHVDGKKFNLTGKTLNRYQDSVLFKCITGSINNDRIFTREDGDKLDVYIDADLDSMSLIISHLRGYPLDLKNIPIELMKKIYYDSKYFNFHDILNCFEEDFENNIFLPTQSNKHEINKDEYLMESDSENSISNSSPICDCDLGDMYNLDNNLNTAALLNGNASDVNNFINSLKEKLKSDDAVSLMNALSTDKTLCDILKKYNDETADVDSDSHSGDDNDLTKQFVNMINENKTMDDNNDDDVDLEETDDY